MRWRFTQLGLLAILILGLAAKARADEPKPASIVTTHMVAMRDEVKLATDVYLPGDGTAKYPGLHERASD